MISAQGDGSQSQAGPQPPRGLPTGLPDERPAEASGQRAVSWSQGRAGTEGNRQHLCPYSRACVHPKAEFALLEKGNAGPSRGGGRCPLALGASARPPEVRRGEAAQVILDTKVPQTEPHTTCWAWGGSAQVGSRLQLQGPPFPSSSGHGG